MTKANLFHEFMKLAPVRVYEFSAIESGAYNITILIRDEDGLIDTDTRWIFVKIGSSKTDTKKADGFTIYLIILPLILFVKMKRRKIIKN